MSDYHFTQYVPSAVEGKSWKVSVYKTAGRPLTCWCVEGIVEYDEVGFAKSFEYEMFVARQETIQSSGRNTVKERQRLLTNMAELMKERKYRPEGENSLETA